MPVELSPVWRHRGFADATIFVVFSSAFSVSKVTVIKYENDREIHIKATVTSAC
jgi:hypothetical protein